MGNCAGASKQPQDAARLEEHESVHPQESTPLQAPPESTVCAPGHTSKVPASLTAIVAEQAHLFCPMQYQPKARVKEDSNLCCRMLQCLGHCCAGCVNPWLMLCCSPAGTPFDELDLHTGDVVLFAGRRCLSTGAHPVLLATHYLLSWHLAISLPAHWSVLSHAQ